MISQNDGIRDEINVTDYTIDGHCSGCGSCCSDYLPLSQGEIERIRAYVKKHNLRKHTASVMVGPSLDMTCPFRDNIRHRCDIYEVRPDICKCFQCNQSVEQIGENKEWYHQRNRVVSMRGEFFGDPLSKLIASQLGRRMKNTGMFPG